jgi:hypothetical protein
MSQIRAAVQLDHLMMGAKSLPHRKERRIFPVGAATWAAPPVIPIPFCISPPMGAYSAMRRNFDPTDYSMVVKHRGLLPNPWRWEIYCAGKRQPIERSSVFFSSREKASLVGKEALGHLLDKFRA